MAVVGREAGNNRFLFVDILLHQSGHIMLSDFDLAKQSGVSGGRPAMIHQEENGVRHISLLRRPFRLLVFQIPLIDTRSCTADFRTNSFVGTEGTSTCFRRGRPSLRPKYLCRVHCSRSHPDSWAYISRGLVDTWYPHLRNDREFISISTLRLRSVSVILSVSDSCFVDSQYATTPFKGAERNDTFHNIMHLPVFFRDTPKVSAYVLHFRQHYRA